MSAIATAVFKATVGLLVQKGRSAVAEKLKDGDVIDQKFRRLILREIDDVKSKLDGLAKKDLVSSISSFKEGIEYLYEVFDKSDSSSEKGVFTEGVAVSTTSRKTRSLTRRMSELNASKLDNPAKKALANAKKRFENAREKARDAFANEALDLSDRILAMQYRVMATVLEACDSPTDALPACRVCIEELHSLTGVKECFAVELKKGFWARFSKDERRKIISAVCQMNRVIYDVNVMVGFSDQEWPSVDTGGGKINPIRDERLTKLLEKRGMEHCFIKPWSFGQEGKTERKLKGAVGITTNSRGQFLIADDGDKTIKVFDSNGKFHLSFNLQTDDANKELNILDVASDEKDMIYVLIGLKKPGAKEFDLEVWIFDKATTLLRKFPMKKGPSGQGRRLTVCDSKVLVLRGSGSGDVVDVYKDDGKFVRSFGGGVFKSARDITAANNHIMVMDTGDTSVHLFTLKGKQESKINVDTEGDNNYRAAFHPAGEHFVVAGHEQGTEFATMAVYTTNGKFVRTIQFSEEKTNSLGGITVTAEGHIAVIVEGEKQNCKVSVIVV